MKAGTGCGLITGSGPTSLGTVPARVRHRRVSGPGAVVVDPPLGPFVTTAWCNGLETIGLCASSTTHFQVVCRRETACLLGTIQGREFAAGRVLILLNGLTPQTSRWTSCHSSRQALSAGRWRMNDGGIKMFLILRSLQLGRELFPHGFGWATGLPRMRYLLAACLMCDTAFSSYDNAWHDEVLELV